MNPVDHPHGVVKVGPQLVKKKPATPWGYPALGRRQTVAILFERIKFFLFILTYISYNKNLLKSGCEVEILSMNHSSNTL
ncbi:hypothetical protein Ahy_A07g031691 isoform B [Arachis hypogaea]|nr:hypothetical protein Ahy_A07g031691 isoform B [Arachis hypogaea]